MYTKTYINVSKKKILYFYQLIILSLEIALTILVKMYQ